MLEFLVRVFSVMTAGVFMFAMLLGVLSEFLGFSMNSKSRTEVFDAPKNQAVEIEKKDTLATDLTASLYQMESKVIIENPLEEQANSFEEELDIEINSIEDLSELILENKVLVLLDNSVLSSFLYEEKSQVLTEVIKIHKDYVETTKGGMTFKGGSIYTHADFLEAFKAAGSNFEIVE